MTMKLFEKTEGYLQEQLQLADQELVKAIDENLDQLSMTGTGTPATSGPSILSPTAPPTLRLSHRHWLSLFCGLVAQPLPVVSAGHPTSMWSHGVEYQWKSRSKWSLPGLPQPPALAEVMGTPNAGPTFAGSSSGKPTIVHVPATGANQVQPLYSTPSAGQAPLGTSPSNGGGDSWASMLKSDISNLPLNDYVPLNGENGAQTYGNSLGTYAGIVKSYADIVKSQETLWKSIVPTPKWKRTPQLEPKMAKPPSGCKVWQELNGKIVEEVSETTPLPQDTDTASDWFYKTAMFVLEKNK